MNNITAARFIHFNHGQKLTPEHLNSLNDFVLRSGERMTQRILAAKGILENSESEFRVDLVAGDPLSVAIQPGAAINSLGQILVLEKTEVVSFKDKLGTQSREFYIQIVPEENLESPYADSDIPEFKGYQYRRVSVKILISKILKQNAIEIARVKLHSKIKSLDLAQESTDISAPEGMVDSRHAYRIRLFSGHQIPYADLRLIQNIVESFRATLFEISGRYLNLKTTQRLFWISMMLESEVSEDGFLFRKIHYLLNESRKACLDLVEELRSLLSKAGQSTAPFWNELLEAAQNIPQERSTRGLLQFKGLQRFTLLIREKICEATTEEEKRILIVESLKDLKTFNFGYQNRHSFGGYLFRQVAALDTKALSDSLTTDAEFYSQKNITAAYETGGEISSKGVFFSEGSVHIPLSFIASDRNAVVLLRVYKRRGIQNFNLLLNGNRIESQYLKAQENIDQFLNIGVLVEGKSFTNGQNQLSIEIDQVDLDFGLFGVWVYQTQEASDL